MRRKILLNFPNSSGGLRNNADDSGNRDEIFPSIVRFDDQHFSILWLIRRVRLMHLISNFQN